MGDMLSQAEIDALLSGAPLHEADSDTKQSIFNQHETEVLISKENMGMQSFAAALTTILGQNVSMVVENLQASTWEEMSEKYGSNNTVIVFDLGGSFSCRNVFIIRSEAARQIIRSMTGENDFDSGDALSEFDLGVIGEIMNQAAGSYVTSLSSSINKSVSITPPNVVESYINSETGKDFIDSDEFIVISCEMAIDNICKDYLLHLAPVSFARTLLEFEKQKESSSSATGAGNGGKKPAGIEKASNNISFAQDKGPESNSAYTTRKDTANDLQTPKDLVSVQPAKFQSFDEEAKLNLEKKNLDLILDVPLQITVELGRTHKLIKNILEYGPGSVIELDKLAGDPVDILVNGKNIAKGEVVVIDESFGVRVTDIVDPSKRL